MWHKMGDKMNGNRRTAALQNSIGRIDIWSNQHHCDHRK